MLVTFTVIYVISSYYCCTISHAYFSPERVFAPGLIRTNLVRFRSLSEYSQLSLIRIRIIRTLTNSNEIPRSPQNFLINSHRKTCIIRTSIIRTFTNPITFCWSPQQKTLYNLNILWIEKHITRILAIIVHWLFVIHVLIYLHIFLSRYDNFKKNL